MFNRNFTLFVVINIVLGMSMPMLIVLGGLAGAALSPVPSMATAVMSVQILAGIVVASPLSLLMAAIGRKRGFLCVALLMIIGGLTGMLALLQQQFVWLCVAHFLLGASLVGVNFLRFAASESVAQTHKANALSLMLASGLVAALLGPTLFDLTKDMLNGFEFSGAYMAIAALGLVGCVPVMGLRESQLVEKSSVAVSGDAQPRTMRQILRDPNVLIAIIVVASSQGVMVLLMVPTPLAMIDLSYLTSDASDVIRWHVVAMFAPGLVTGFLIHRVGVLQIIACGAVMLVCSAFIAIADITLPYFYCSLILLGAGWNFGFIGGTYLLQQSIVDNERGRVQGLNDTLLAASGAFASVASGALYITVGWSFVSYVAISWLLIALLLVILVKRPPKPPINNC